MKAIIYLLPMVTFGCGLAYSRLYTCLISPLFSRCEGSFELNTTSPQLQNWSKQFQIHELSKKRLLGVRRISYPLSSATSENLLNKIILPIS